jgi:hypothetical protein
MLIGLTMKAKDKIDNHFLGITDEDLAEHNNILKKVIKQSKEMIRREVKKIRRICNEEGIQRFT